MFRIGWVRAHVENDYRLTPAMASRKLQVASFYQQYKERWGRYPSYGEAAGAMGIQRSTARDAVRRAVRDKLLDLPRGARRGVAPVAKTVPRLTPEQAAIMLAQLRDAGVVLADVLTGADGRTSCPLPLVPELTHIPCGDDGDEQDARADARRAGGNAGDHEPEAPKGGRRAA